MKAQRAVMLCRVLAFVACSAAAERALAWGPDVNVTTHEGATEATGAPTMVATSTKGLFMVRDNATNDCFDVMRSGDGGRTWYQYFWYCGGSASIQGHQISIAVPEKTQDYMYVVFTEGSSEVRLLKVDLANPWSWSWKTIVSNAESRYHNPVVITDNIGWTEYFLYVGYSESRVAWDFAGVPWFQRSLDKGETWSTPAALATRSSWFGGLAFANNRLYYASYACYYDCGDVSVSTSTDYGASWQTAVVASTVPGHDLSNPRIAAVQGGSQVVVVYDYEYSSTDIDLYYSYSTDGGVTWKKNLPLATSSLNASTPVVGVDQTPGRFHLAFAEGGDIRYASAPYADPTRWSYPVTVSDGHRAAGCMPPAFAIDWTSGKPGVAWSDTRTGTPAIYLDRADF